jgi:hypothetical protein
MAFPTTIRSIIDLRTTRRTFHSFLPLDIPEILLSEHREQPDISASDLGRIAKAWRYATDLQAFLFSPFDTVRH